MAPRIAIPVPTSFDPAYNRLNFADYADAIRASGGEAVEVALDLSHGRLIEVAGSCDGILLPGSPADVDPARYGQAADEATAPADARREFTDETLLAWAMQQRKPTLGICFGMQMLNVFSGGTLIQDLNVMPVNHAAGRSVGVAHTAAVSGESSLAGIVSVEEAPVEGSYLRLPVNSSHHQAVGILGRGLRVGARCPQDGVVEAVEAISGESFLVGVQWHPERTYESSASSRRLFDRFVAEAAAGMASAGMKALAV